MIVLPHLPCRLHKDRASLNCGGGRVKTRRAYLIGIRLDCFSAMKVDHAFVGAFRTRSDLAYGLVIRSAVVELRPEVSSVELSKLTGGPAENGSRDVECGAGQLCQYPSGDRSNFEPF
jgi:hypothetical protein